MDFTRSSYQSTNFAFSFEYFVTREMSLVLSIDAYSKNKLGTYKEYSGYSFVEGDFAFYKDYEPYADDYVGGPFSTSHSFNVSITPIQASLKFTPTGRKGRLIPYVGGGAGVYIWNVRLQGESIDFSDEWIYTNSDTGEEVTIYPINYGLVSENNLVTIGFHAFGGVMVPVGRRMTLELELKYNIVKGKFPEKDPDRGFHGFESFDLSGYQVSVGINYWF
jgi:hypothetical protein